MKVLLWDLEEVNPEAVQFECQFDIYDPSQKMTGQTIESWNYAKKNINQRCERTRAPQVALSELLA